MHFLFSAFFVMVYASHTNKVNCPLFIHMNQFFIVLTILLYFPHVQVAGEDEGWSCVGENILDVLLEMQKERERKEEV